MNLYIKEMDQNKFLLFFPYKLRLYVTNKYTREVAELINQGWSYDDIKELKPNISKTLYLKLYSNLHTDGNSLNTPLKMDKLERLVINISNECNMCCKYCYANNGNYQSESRLMSVDTLRRTLDVMYGLYPEIELIQLFGGEPMLNTEVLKEACLYIEKHKKSSEIGMVSNGTIVTDELIELIQNYNFHITISIDTEQIHDKLRMFKGGRGSFDIIRKNIDRLRRETKEPYMLEVTYTKLHEDHGIKINDVIRELNQTFPGIPVHMVCVSSNDPKYRINDSTAFVTSVVEEFENITSLDMIKSSAVDRYLAPFKRQSLCHHFCHAGYDSISISSEGDIYPCSAFIDKEEFYIANIYDKEEELSGILNQMRRSYYDIKRNEEGKCKDCFAKTLCSGCLHVNYTDTGDANFASERFCKITRDSVEQVLLHMAMLQERSQKIS